LIDIFHKIFRDYLGHDLPLLL